MIETEETEVMRNSRRNLVFRCCAIRPLSQSDGFDWAQHLNKQAAHYPVVTLVLYFGHERRWSGPLTLKERLDIPKEFDTGD